ncbi:ANTAR domain-containing protein [Amycolatopsis sp. CA-230715]|uniref:ANTAR domain-containing protein n=1 Tax=Amycolatopsis sp. CA-230715 TaxID=2745196 RepID=UPI001C035CB7|nr:ANTAR domain-containing protein [Amycolatopsis sp. CA-230715]QWF85188.1 hypothetical protein HUW46_08642 [Amycolatopsis sp. CA-230715]
MNAELLPRTFVELTDALPGGVGLDRFTRLVVDKVIELVGADSAVLLLAGRGATRPTLASGSSQRARELGQLQLSLDEGPCLDAFRDGVAVRYPEDRQWPRFSHRVGSDQEFSLDAIPLRREDISGALGIIRVGSTGLDATALGAATAIADLAAISIARHGRLRTRQRHAKRLRSTLDVLITVEQAKGILAERTGTDIETAHKLMQDYAHVQNESMSGIARRVVAETGKPT